MPKKYPPRLVSMCCGCVTVRREFANRMSSYKSSGSPKFIAFGNVLVDASVKLNDLDILNRYNLRLDSKGEIDIETLTEIWKEIRDRLVAPACCGGSALNTVRILTHLGTRCMFFGSVGKDQPAELLKGILTRAGVHTRLQEHSDYSTGKCVCFIYGCKNALYSNIGASAKFSVDYLQQIEKEENFLQGYKNQQIFYMESFFITQRMDVVRYIIRKYISNERILAINLSATYIIEENFDIITFLVHSAELVFGNREEFSTLSKKCGFRTLHDFCSQELKQKSSTVFVITSDKNNVELIRNTGSRDEPNIIIDSFAVPMVPVYDTTGAGDAFVAGFMHSYLKGCPLTTCVQHAIAIAGKVVQQLGCNLP